MSDTSELKRCSQCGGPIPAEAPQGLCPKCLLLQASAPTETGRGAADRGMPPTRNEVAAAFPHLEILELIGQGGMGFVFKARQPKLDRLVALKILPQSLAADPAFAERFGREGRVLAKLNHPNIVTIHDFGQANGFFYLLMEFVDGVNLRQAMKVGRFTPAQALAIVPKICEALQFAHNEGILHRDIKPENILIDTKGRVKIADFGIAKLVGMERGSVSRSAVAELERGSASRSTSDREGAVGSAAAGSIGEAAAGHRPALLALTEAGRALGTPQYMAPEQLENPQDVDPRADIYSLGVVFYEMLTGEVPVGKFAPPSEKSSVDPRVDEVVLRTLEKERERRTKTAGEVKTQVETIATSPQQFPASGAVKRRPTLVIGAVVLTALGWLVSCFSVQISRLVPSGPESEGALPMLFLLCAFLQFAGSVLGAMALWDLPAGKPRLSLGAALATAFLPLLLSVNWGLVLPGVYMLWFGVIQHQPISSMHMQHPLISSLLLVAAEVLLLLKVWPWVAKTYELSNESLRPSALSYTGGRDSVWRSISAWVFIGIAALELIGALSTLTSHRIAMPTGRGIGNLFAGLALLTLNPRWRTAALVCLWSGLAAWGLGVVGCLRAPDIAELRFAGLIVKSGELPVAFVLVAIAGVAFILWPYWMLTNKWAMAIFGLLDGSASQLETAMSTSPGAAASVPEGAPSRQHYGRYFSGPARLRDCWVWDPRLAWWFLLVPVIVTLPLIPLLYFWIGWHALWLLAFDVGGLAMALTYVVVGVKVRRLKTTPAAATGEVAEALIATRTFESPGVAILRDDVLELVPIVGAPIPLARKDVISFREVTWFNGSRLWTKTGLILELAGGARIGVALPRPIGERWKAVLSAKAAAPSGAPSASAASPEAPVAATGGKLGYLALGLFLAGTLGTLLLMTLSYRHELALIFGGLALVLSLVFGFMGRRERLGRFVLVANIVILAGIGLLIAISIPIVFLERRQLERREAEAVAQEKRLQLETLRRTATEGVSSSTNPVAVKAAAAYQGDIWTHYRCVGTVESSNSIVFAIPQDYVQEVVRNLNTGPPLAVDAYDRDQKLFGHGYLRGVANQIDADTGTLKCEARLIPQGSNLMIRGLFLDVRLQVGVRHGTTLVPAAAVQHDPEGAFVWLIRPDQTVARRPVTVSMLDGETIGIQSGLSPGDFVVVDGGEKLHEGSLVWPYRQAPNVKTR